MKLVPEELYTLDTTILVPEELYAIVLIPEELFMYLWVESIVHDSHEGKLLEYKYESYCIEIFLLYNQKLVWQWE